MELLCRREMVLEGFPWLFFLLLMESVDAARSNL